MSASDFNANLSHLKGLVNAFTVKEIKEEDEDE